MILKKKGVAKKESKGNKFIKVAEELTKVMDLDPPIDTEQDESDLKDTLIEAGGMLKPDDDISELAQEVLTELGVELPTEEEEEEPPAKKKPAKKEVPAKKPIKKAAKKVEEEEEEEEAKKVEEEEEEEEVEGDELDELDRSGLKKFIADNELEVKVFKSMSDDDIRTAIRALAEPEEEEKPTKKATKKVEKKPAKKVEKAEAGPTRADVFNEIMIEGGGTFEEIVDLMHDNYKDGKSSEAEAKYKVGVYLNLLKTMGYAKKDADGKYILKKK